MAALARCDRGRSHRRILRSRWRDHVLLIPQPWAGHRGTVGLMALHLSRTPIDRCEGALDVPACDSRRALRTVRSVREVLVGVAREAPAGSFIGSGFLTNSVSAGSSLRRRSSEEQRPIRSRSARRGSPPEQARRAVMQVIIGVDPHKASHTAVAIDVSVPALVVDARPYRRWDERSDCVLRALCRRSFATGRDRGCSTIEASTQGLDRPHARGLEAEAARIAHVVVTNARVPRVVPAAVHAAHGIAQGFVVAQRLGGDRTDGLVAEKVPPCLVGHEHETRRSGDERQRYQHEQPTATPPRRRAMGRLLVPPNGGGLRWHVCIVSRMPPLPWLWTSGASASTRPLNSTSEAASTRPRSRSGADEKLRRQPSRYESDERPAPQGRATR